ncbi:hypothetical protein Taro_012712 [Colocasia esculenta]|uniref:Uncharacterized protein n=1 Tax=Colocasia esculenta TaxID=4460 RepID=A0A843UDR9_COLES|nr:hypothetical protein [Colocasia esculenta]
MTIEKFRGIYIIFTAPQQCSLLVQDSKLNLRHGWRNPPVPVLEARQGAVAEVPREEKPPLLFGAEDAGEDEVSLSVPVAPPPSPPHPPSSPSQPPWAARSGHSLQRPPCGALLCQRRQRRRRRRRPRRASVFPSDGVNCVFYVTAPHIVSFMKVASGTFFLVPGATMATILMLGLLHTRRLYDDKKVKEMKEKGIQPEFSPDVKRLSPCIAMDGKVGRLGAESADSELGRPLATRLGGGDTHPPTRLGLQSPLSDSARLRPDSGSGSAGADPATRPDSAILHCGKELASVSGASWAVLFSAAALDKVAQETGDHQRLSQDSSAGRRLLSESGAGHRRLLAGIQRLAPESGDRV